MGHLALYQDQPLKRWDTSHCAKTLRPSVGTLHTVPRPSVGTPRTVPRPYTQVLGHLALSQDQPLKRGDNSYCPKSPRLSVGTLHTVPRPSVGTPRTVPIPPTQVLGHLALSQDCLLKCWDNSYSPKTPRLNVGTLHTVPRPSVGRPRTVSRPPTQVLGHFALSQDYLFKCWDASYCPKTLHSSVGILRTVPRLPAQVFRPFVLSLDLFVPVLGQSDLFFFAVGTLRSLSPVPPLEPYY